MNILILRDKKDSNIETTGRLYLDNFDSFECYTLELPWKDNKNEVSCIPEGKYNWIKVLGTKRIPYTHITLDGVYGRSGICIHKANFAAGNKVDLEGCIGVGVSLKDINNDGIIDISNSGDAFNKLMSILPSKGTVEIKYNNLIV